MRLERQELRQFLRRTDLLPASNEVGDGAGRASGLRGDPLAELVKGCKRNDSESQQRLYDACSQRVYQLVARIVGMQDAADVAQQAFMQVFRSIDSFDGRSGFATWLYRIALNASLQHVRRNRRHRTTSLDWEPMDDSRGEEDADWRDALEQALARIDPELRAIFLLREVDRMSYREIAEAMHIPEGTVGSRLNRARGELRKLLASFGLEL